MGETQHVSEAARIMALFDGFQGAHGTHGQPDLDPGGLKWAIKRTARTIREPVTVLLWEEHLAGRRPLGVIPIRADGLCRWGSIDVDQYDINLLELVKRVEDTKLPLVPCRSKSGGLHLFLFMIEPLPAGMVQAVLRDLAAQLGLAGCEIFPKQTELLTDRGDAGNWMVMPYYGDTYGGKIKEQVGLKRTGAELTLGEFLGLAERSRLTEQNLTELGRRRSRAASTAGSRQRKGAPPRPAEPFGDGPPCLQHLADGGVPMGVQSSTLFMMGLYFKRTDAENWKANLEEAGRTYFRPPVTADGLTTVVRSLEKKEYEYTCKIEPMVSHCDSLSCRARRFGVGGGSNFPVISGISKLDTDPPVWFVDVEGKRIDCTTEQLQNYTLFHRLCMDRVHQCYRIMASKDWMTVLSAAMEGMTLIDAPPEVGASGRFRELLDEFLTNRARGVVKEDLLSGRPWEEEETGRHWFRLSDLIKFLTRENFKETRGQTTQRIRDLGGAYHEVNVKGKCVSAWWVPSATVQPNPEPDAPPLRPEPI